MTKLPPLEHLLIHPRAREEFGWTEYGYISASLFFLHKPPSFPTVDNGLGVAGDMATDFRMNEGQRRGFFAGWNHYLEEWKHGYFPETHQNEAGLSRKESLR